ncbi:hypothetical protein EDB85DRAFT_2275144 [Lactarius pseudohatsudake]|nr:hypothetical protein EDB85DRAFT_2275144 [Lactarius pseudohatsudake]
MSPAASSSPSAVVASPSPSAVLSCCRCRCRRRCCSCRRCRHRLEDRCRRRCVVAVVAAVVAVVAAVVAVVAASSPFKLSLQLLSLLSSSRSELQRQCSRALPRRRSESCRKSLLLLGCRRRCIWTCVGMAPVVGPAIDNGKTMSTTTTTKTTAIATT